MQLIIRDLVESYVLKIAPKNAPGIICAVSTLEDIYSNYGYHVLNHVLQLCIGAWEGEANSFSSVMLRAVAKLLVTYRDAFNDDVFIERLGAISIKALNRSAKERRRGFMGMAEVLVLEYNGKKKNSPYRLQINQLNEKEPKLIDQKDLMLNQEANAYNQSQDVIIEDDYAPGIPDSE